MKIRYIIIPLLICLFINALSNYICQIRYKKDFSVFNLSIFNILCLIIPLIIFVSIIITIPLLEFLINNW